MPFHSSPAAQLFDCVVKTHAAPFQICPAGQCFVLAGVAGVATHFPFLSSDSPEGQVVHGSRLQRLRAMSGSPSFGPRGAAARESLSARPELARVSVLGALGS